jgi:hypothetical protein
MFPVEDLMCWKVNKFLYYDRVAEGIHASSE